jgi:hypothetical protein
LELKFFFFLLGRQQQQQIHASPVIYSHRIVPLSISSKRTFLNADKKGFPSSPFLHRIFHLPTFWCFLQLWAEKKKRKNCCRFSFSVKFNLHVSVNGAEGREGGGQGRRVRIVGMKCCMWNVPLILPK